MRYFRFFLIDHPHMSYICVSFLFRRTIYENISINMTVLDIFFFKERITPGDEVIGILSISKPIIQQKYQYYIVLKDRVSRKMAKL